VVSADKGGGGVRCGYLPDTIWTTASSSPLSPIIMSPPKEKLSLQSAFKKGSSITKLGLTAGSAFAYAAKRSV